MSYEDEVIEVHKEVVYENVNYHFDRDIYVIFEDGNKKTYTSEYVQSMGWNYDSDNRELYNYYEDKKCSECEVDMMFDTQAEEFYCPICITD